MRKLLSILLCVLPFVGRGITFWWQPTIADGYALYVWNDQVEFRYDVTTTNFSSQFPPGWYRAMVRSYSTNNSDAVAVEGESSNEVMFVIPDPVVVHAVVGIPLVTPITQLSSNPVARITVFLEESTNLKTWEQASPVFQYDVGGRSNGFLRTRLGVSPIP